MGEEYRVLVASGDDDIKEELKDCESILDVDGMEVYLLSSAVAEGLRRKLEGSEGDLLSYAGISDVYTGAADLKKAYRQAKAGREVSFCRDIVHSATVLHPDYNIQMSCTFYTDTRPFGVQRYDPSARKTYYEGMTFNMIEV